jgi:hypothetical protein
MSIKQNFPTIDSTLNLDFANSRVVDSRITFVRASAATVTDANGIIQTVRDNKPRIDFDGSTGECKGLLIEEQRTNLMSLSAVVVNGGVNVVSQPYTAETLAPDGTLSAVKITPTSNSVGAFYYDYSTSIAALNAGTYTYSAWVKGPVGYGIRAALLYSSGGNVEPFFSFTGSWQKITVTKTYDGTASGYIRLHPFICRGTPGAAADTGLWPYYFYMWNPQLETGSFATSSIIPVTTFTSRASSATYYDASGVLRTAPANGARYGYGYDTASAKWISQGLLIEPAATNLIPGSNLFGDTISFEPIWTKTNSSTDVTAPDGSALTTKMVSGTTGNTWYWKELPGGTYAANTTYTHSVWIRTAAGTTGTVGFQPYPYNGGGTVTVTDQWQRFTATFTTNASGTSPYIGLVSPQASRTFYVWGWQAEAGTVATSYIPTISAATTRAGDSIGTAAATRASDNASMTGTNFTSWWNNSAHSVYAEAETFKIGNDYMIAECANDSNSIVEMSLTFAGSAANKIQYISRLLATNNDIRSVPAYSANTFIKIAGSGSTTTTLGAAGGVAGTVGANQSQSLNANQLYIGSRKGGSLYLNGHIKKLVFFNQALSQTQLTALTV